MVSAERPEMALDDVSPAKWRLALLTLTVVSTAGLGGGLSASRPAHATPASTALNGTYTATSDGNMAKRNRQFKDLPSVTSTWTITSTCSSPVDCSGQVTSDQGWRADLRLIGGSLWIATHDVENWERCPDGSAFPGHQQFKFYSIDDSHLRGWDETKGPSGACGANEWLYIEMPLTLVKVG